jgi:hypothetical protein
MGRDGFDRDCVRHHAFYRSERFPGCRQFAPKLAGLFTGGCLCNAVVGSCPSVFGAFSPPQKFRFPEMETLVRRDAVRMRVY